MNNRLDINPLVEENMNQMVDGEITINQINGHMTIKHGEKYISKTKTLNIELIDKKNFKDDLLPKINKDEEYLLNHKQKSTDIENTNIDIESKLKEILDKTIEYESKCEQYEDKIRGLDTSLKSKLHDAQININNAINNNIKLLGSLMIENELMDRISDNQGYYKNYVENHWRYPDKNDSIKSYGTIEQHNNNKQEVNKRVNKSDYDSFISEIEAMYRNVGANYNVRGGL